MPRTKKLTMVDLFAGCGGLSLGMENAGFEPVFVNELHSDALSTYILNRPKNSFINQKSRQLNDIRVATRDSGSLKNLAKMLHREHGEIHLLAGGPPCQGYSARGIRSTFSHFERSEMPSNHLYIDMAKFITEIGPRAFLFENVAGILQGRWTKDGEPGEIWQDVLGTFQAIQTRKGGKHLSYNVDFALVRAGEYGVPQNRPRVIMIGVREDIDLKSTSTRASGLIPDPSGKPPSISEALQDLVDPNWINGGQTLYYPKRASGSLSRYFRTDLNGFTHGIHAPITEQKYSNHRPEVLQRYRYMIEHNGEFPPGFHTKKFGQKILPSEWTGAPNITVTSAPDDYIHFAQPRILTVREWARLQTFPDWYQFRGPRTTGGKRRAGNPDLGSWDRDVPKYTQIGNAVPVLLAKALGEHLKKIIS